MEYNSQRSKLIIPEYGRNIQKMIDYAISVDDKDKRNMAAKVIIDVMGQLNPHLRDITDFRHKLWDHLFIIADFKLDVDSPYPIPSAETLKTKPKRIPYPHQDIKYKHYGKTIELLIEKAVEMEDGMRKDTLVSVIANFMKTSYLNWNRDSVNDEMILEQLDTLSQNKLKLTTRLNNTSDILAKNKSVKKTKPEEGRRRGRRKQ